MRYFIWCLIFCLQLAWLPPAHGQAAKPEFTKIQDLNANAGGGNQPVRQKWAVVIGVSKFKDARLDNNMPNDRAAREFHKYLTDPQCGRFASDHVRLLTNETANQQNILNSLGKPWLGAAAGKDDLVIVFIATNGFPTTDGDAYLCSYNCALDNIYSTCISMKKLMQHLKDNVAAQRVVLVLQACHSGSAELSDVSGGAKSLGKSYVVDFDKLMLGTGYIILSSSKPDQLTFGDTFSQNLIAALKDKNGMIPLREAFAKACQATEYDTTYKQYPAKTQTPIMKSQWQGNDLIIGAPPLETVANLPASVNSFLGAEAHYLNASKLAGQGNIDAAVAEYKLAIANDPNCADAVADYGAALAIQGNWKDALVKLHEAVSLRPDDVLFRVNYARALDQTGNSAECVKQLEFAYNLNPKDSSVLRALASKALAVGDAATAEKMWKEALTLYPKSALFYDKLAYSESVSGKLDEALSNARKAMELDPQLCSAQLNVGSILAMKGDLPEAITALRSAAQKHPDNADAWFLLSQALQRNNDQPGEIDALSQFLAHCSGSDKRAENCRIRLTQLNPKL